MNTNFYMNNTVKNPKLIKTILDQSSNIILSKYQEILDNNQYITYYLDSSNNKHNEERHYTADVGLYPGGYGWSDLDYIYEYDHGLLLSITHYINNYKSQPDVYYAHEYNPITNSSIAVYYEYKYEYDDNDNYEPVIKGWAEYLIDGHFKEFNKDTFNGIVYEWKRTEMFGDILNVIHLYENGSSVKKLKQFYQNGFLKKDSSAASLASSTHTPAYKYNYSSNNNYTLNDLKEEYFIQINSKKVYYKFMNEQLIEKSEYAGNNKNGTSIIYNCEHEIKDKYSKYKNIKMKLIFIDGKEFTRKTFDPLTEYLYNNKDNTSIVTEFYNSHYDHSQKIKYTVSGHYLDLSTNNYIKVGSYMEWHKNGALFLMMHYKDGKLDGPVISFYENGLPNVKGMYKNGSKTGVFSYSENDKLNNKVRYYNHDTNKYIYAIDIGEPFRGLSELDSWSGFPYSAF